MAEVAQQPPQPLRAAHVPVGDDEDAVADACARRGARKSVEIRQRMAASRARLRREIGVDVEEARARDMAGEVELTTAAGVSQLPTAVDELVSHTHEKWEKVRLPGSRTPSSIIELTPL